MSPRKPRLCRRCVSIEAYILHQVQIHTEGSKALKDLKDWEGARALLDKASALQTLGLAIARMDRKPKE